MKIGFITPPISECGGIQRVLTLLANYMAQTCEVMVISLNDPGSTPYYSMNEQIQIVYYNRYFHKKWRVIRRGIRAAAKKYNWVLPASVGAYAYYPGYMTRKVAEILSEEKCDCVIASTVHCSVLLGMIAKDLKGSKLIGWHHNSYHIYFQTPGQGYYIQSRLSQKALKKLDVLVTLTSHDAREYEENMGIHARYIYNPLGISSNSKSDVSKPVLLFVSRLKMRQKGLDLLIAIADILFHQRGYRNWSLRIVGGGSDEQKVMDLIRKYGLEDQVELLGERSDVENEYVDASIFLSTSRWEGFGMVVTEAMECGLPVVSFKTDGPSEIIQDGACGYLIDNYNLQQYADKVEILMCDKELRERMSKNAVIRAKDFYPEKIMGQWQKLICEETAETL